MAVQIESRGQLQEFLEILQRRRWQVLLPALFVIAFGAAFAVIVPKKYVVRTQVELRPVSVSVSSKDGANATFQIRARERVRKVVGDLKNEEYLALPPEDRYTFLLDVLDDLKVRLDRAGDGVTTFVNIEYASVDPLWARTFLRALRDDWINDVLERDRNKLRDEKAKLYEEKQNLERQLAREEEGTTELKRKYNISATQPTPGGEGSRNEDPIFARLQVKSVALDGVAGELEQRKIEQETLQKRYDAMPEMLASDQEVVAGSSNDTAVAELDTQIEDKLKELKGYRPAHPKFRELKQELDELNDHREQISRIVTRSEVITSPKPNPDRAPLLKQIEDVELAIKKLEATQKRLTKEVDDDERTHRELQTVYEQLRFKGTIAANLAESLKVTSVAYTSKAQQLEVVEGPLGNPFSITEEVVPPAKPTEPNPWIIVSGAIVLGFALGLGHAVMLEFSKNSFRSVHDNRRVMSVPVLGSINTIVTRREVRLFALRRIVVGVSSILLIGSVVFVTWAWARSPELLSPGVREKIEAFRTKFR